MPAGDSLSSAQVLQVYERLFLIDCAEGAQNRMVALRIPFSRLDGIFISHIHGDHLFGLFGLLSTLGMTGRTAPLPIWGPSNMGPILKFFLSYYGEGLRFEILFTPLKCSGMEEIWRGKRMRVLAFPLRHGIETYGFRFEELQPLWNVHKDAIARYGLNLTEIGTLKRGEDVFREDGAIIPAAEAAYVPYEPRAYVYCSDTEVFEEEKDYVRGADVLYHETTYTEQSADKAELYHHAVTSQVAALARDAGVGRLLIGHYSSRCRERSVYEAECRAVFPETYACNDGDVFEISK